MRPAEKAVVEYSFRKQRQTEDEIHKHLPGKHPLNINVFERDTKSLRLQGHVLNWDAVQVMVDQIFLFDLFTKNLQNLGETMSSTPSNKIKTKTDK